MLGAAFSTKLPSQGQGFLMERKWQEPSLAEPENLLPVTMSTLLCYECSQPCLQYGQHTGLANLARILTPNYTAGCQAVPGFLPCSPGEGMRAALCTEAIDAVVVVSPSWS